MGWCGSLPVDYSPCNMLALWDCGLRPVSSAGSAPTAPGLQTEKETLRLWAGGGEPPSVCSHRLPSEVRPGACFLTRQSLGTISPSETRRSWGARPRRLPRPPYGLSVCFKGRFRVQARCSGRTN